MQGYYSYKTGILKITGKDKLDYLNRISTNRCTSVSDMSYIKTVFLNDKGKIIDFCTVLSCNDSVFLITTPGNDAKLKAHIDKYTVTEDINVMNYTGIINYFTGTENIATDFKSEGEKVHIRDGCYIYIDNYGFPKIVLLEINNTDSMFLQNYASKTANISDNDFEIYCINNFHLFRTNELNDDNNPLECYLDDYISFNKGCYIGQEVISRMNSQGKIPKYLVNFKSDFKIANGDLIYADIENKDTVCGHVTSTVEKESKYFGFGFIKSSILRGNNIYRINGNEILINYKYN